MSFIIHGSRLQLECTVRRIFSDDMLGAIFDFIRENQALVSGFTPEQWIALKNHFNQLYDSIAFLILLLELSKNTPHLLMKEFTLFTDYLNLKGISDPVTCDNFLQYKNETLFYAKRGEMLSK